jgi:hypothetical protein
MATTKKAAKPKARIELLEPGNPLFWVSHFLAEDQITVELDALHTEMHRRGRSELTTYALCAAACEQSFKVRDVARTLRDRGQLLFAFAGTAALQGGAA